MKKLSLLLEELAKYIPEADKCNLSVSAGSVGWHIEHTFKTFSLITAAVKHSNPENYRSSFNATKLLVFALKKIPRGRVKAPEAVQPVGEMNAEILLRSAGEARKKMNDWEGLTAHHHFTHPFFGKLNVKATLKFLNIHTHHHLKIIREISKSVI